MNKQEAVRYWHELTSLSFKLWRDKLYDERERLLQLRNDLKLIYHLTDEEICQFVSN